MVDCQGASGGAKVGDLDPATGLLTLRGDIHASAVSQPLVQGQPLRAIRWLRNAFGALAVAMLIVGVGVSIANRSKPLDPSTLPLLILSVGGTAFVSALFADRVLVAEGRYATRELVAGFGEIISLVLAVTTAVALALASLWAQDQDARSMATIALVIWTVPSVPMVLLVRQQRRVTQLDARTRGGRVRR